VEGAPWEGDDGSSSLSAAGAGVDDLKGVFDDPVRVGNDGLVDVGVGWVFGDAVRRKRMLGGTLALQLGAYTTLFNVKNQ